MSVVVHVHNSINSSHVQNFTENWRKSHSTCFVRHCAQPGEFFPNNKKSSSKSDPGELRVQNERKPEKFWWNGILKDSNNNDCPSTSRPQITEWLVCAHRSDEPMHNINMDISTGHMILAYLEQHLTNQDKLAEEWGNVALYQPDVIETTDADMPENKYKNRSQAVVPYNHARVKLESIMDTDGTGYINASPLCDSDPRQPVYIAAQAPLQSTASEFWQMIWEQGSVIIVNLTRLNEDGDDKCYRYWPENGSEVHGIFEIHLVSEHIWCEDYLVRSFYLKNLRTSETRTITQFHYVSWSDGTVPSNTKPLLEFRRKVNKSYRGRASPIVVHCSDGAGRTGTYCLLDMVLNRIIKGAKEIDILASLEHLRDQRMGLVGNKQQYEFVLRCVAIEVQAILKALKAAEQ